jgi:hypothetical protein
VNDWLQYALKLAWVLMLAWLVWMGTYLTWMRVRAHWALHRFAAEENVRFAGQRTVVLPTSRYGYLIRIVAGWVFILALAGASFWWMIW